MPKEPKCSYCGDTGHTSINCFKKPRKPIAVKKPLKRSKKPIAPESKKTRKLRQATKKQWLKENPPNHEGYWLCYLRISPDCPRWLTEDTLTLEHIQPKVKRKDLRFKTFNIASACSECNKLKSSKSLEQLAQRYPHLRELL